MCVCDPMSTSSSASIILRLHCFCAELPPHPLGDRVERPFKPACAHARVSHAADRCDNARWIVSVHQDPTGPHHVPCCSQSIVMERSHPHVYVITSPPYLWLSTDTPVYLYPTQVHATPHIHSTSFNHTNTHALLLSSSSWALTVDTVNKSMEPTYACRNEYTGILMSFEFDIMLIVQSSEQGGRTLGLTASPKISTPPFLCERFQFCSGPPRATATR
jgi:hypothetical protein